MFFKKEPKGELIKLKDGTEVTLVFEVSELRKIDPRKIKEWQNKDVEEYTHNNQVKKKTMKESKAMLDDGIKRTKQEKGVVLYVFYKDKLIGIGGIFKNTRRRNHTAGFGITVSKKYRNKGLGQTMTRRLIELTKERFKDVKIITLEAYENNPLGLAMYKKSGFEEVARLPKAIQWNPPGAKNLEYKDLVVMNYYL